MRENTKTEGSVSVTAKEKCISQEEPPHTAAAPLPTAFYLGNGFILQLYLLSFIV